MDVIGGLNLKKEFKDNALSIFIMPPSIKILEERLRSRSTESEKNIQKRISKAMKEISYRVKFDRIIINEDLESAISEAELIIKEFLLNE